MNIRERLLARLRQPDYVPEALPVLLSTLGLARRDRRKLEHELRLLESEGGIVRIKRDRYCLPSDADLITGRMVFRQNGGGLLIPETPPGQREREPVEIFPEDTGVAMHGDKVVVRLSDRKINRPARGRPGESQRRATGAVIRILERARTTITGNLQRTKLFYYVAPDDPRFVHDIYVPDPAQSSLRPMPRIDDKVVVRLHEWTQRHINPEGEIVEVLGRTHEPRAELKGIFHKYRLETQFPEAVMREVEAVPAEVPASDLRHRLDIRTIPTLTIDPDDAKDFDDALSLEHLRDGEMRIGIHIADVPAYVRPGTALDVEAQKRGNSTYLVGTVVPMLPHPLSNGICSLKEGVDRLTKSVFLTFTRHGKLREKSFANTVIRSIKRLTYKQAYALLKEDDPAKIRELPAPPAHQTGSTGRPLAELSHDEIIHLRDLVRAFWGIASRLRRERMQGGSLDLDMPETKIFVDEEGYADRLEKILHDESHQLIEEFMLAANESVAKAMREANLPCIYRVHDEPDEEKLQELREYLGTFNITCGDLTNRAELVKLLVKLRDHPQGYILRTQVLRSLKKAAYRGTPDGHFGLNKRDYTHFTSPIRRYSDLIVHRVFAHYVTKFCGQPAVPGAKVDYTAAKIASLGEHLSQTEINSTEAERESVKVKLLEFFERELAKKKPTRFAAIITEARNHGMFIELTESMTFGLVHVSTMVDDLYSLDPSGTALIGRRSKKRFSVGQTVEVSVARVDRYKRQVDFRIVGTGESSAAAPVATAKAESSTPTSSSTPAFSRRSSSSPSRGKPRPDARRKNSRRRRR